MLFAPAARRRSCPGMEYSRFTVEEHEEFVQWLRAVDLATRVAVVRRLDRLRRGHGGAVEAVGRGVFALVVDEAPGCRIFVHRSGPQVTVLLAAATAAEARLQARVAQALARGVHAGTVHDARAAV